MQTLRARKAALVILLIAALPAFGQPAAQPAAVPRQDIVFVIDNSGSMHDSDPLSLRGVAAGLILDAVEVSSDVQAGLVNFSDAASTDGKLNPPSLIRTRLQGNHLPAPGGATNMEDGLARAIGILSASTASIKRIVMITDGAPAGGSGTDNQKNAILNTLRPHAQQLGIQIFALGLTNAVDRPFLEQVTNPTGGATLVTDNQQHLLETAKQLVGDLDNIFNLAHRRLPSNESSYQFDLPHGTDRARATIILDQPQEFGENDLAVRLEGPNPGGETVYTVRTNAGDRIAAWTSFFSTPGRYTLHIDSHKPGGHRGVQLFIEALSTLHLQLSVNPLVPTMTFGADVSVAATVTSGTGTVDPSTLKVSGVVKNPAGGSTVIAFNGLTGTFKVPDVGGRHTIVVRAETPLAKAESHYDYEALRPDCGRLQSNRAVLTFSPVGPAHPEVEESFTLAIEPPPAPLCHNRFSFTVTSPVGIAELLTDSGTVLHGGITEYPIPPQGEKLRLRVRLDPNKRLPSSGGKYQADIVFYTKDAGALTLPFQVPLQIPEFKLRDKADVFSLWWDPHQPRVVRLGTLHTDLTETSAFTAVIPDAIYDANKRTKIAELTLRAGGRTPEGEPFESGKLRYEGLELPPGDGVPLELVITPEQKNGWETLPPSQTAVPVRLLSALGMEAEAKPRFSNLGPIDVPLLGTRSRHGRHIATALLLALGVATLAMFVVNKLRYVRRFWAFRPGALQILRSGVIEIGDAMSGAAALVLPNSGSPLDDSQVGRVYMQGTRQCVESLGDIPLVERNPLSPGDPLTIAVSDPDDPEAPPITVWELDYIDYTQGTGGEVEVTSSPARWTVAKLFRRTLLGILLLFLLDAALGWGWVAKLAYAMPFVERFYVK